MHYSEGYLLPIFIVIMIITFAIGNIVDIYVARGNHKEKKVKSINCP